MKGFLPENKERPLALRLTGKFKTAFPKGKPEPDPKKAPLANADEGQVLDAAIALDDLVRDARQRARQAIAVHYDGHRTAP